MGQKKFHSFKMELWLCSTKNSPSSITMFEPWVIFSGGKHPSFLPESLLPCKQWYSWPKVYVQVKKKEYSIKGEKAKWSERGSEYPLPSPCSSFENSLFTTPLPLLPPDSVF
uniref:Uncharacterized protein n=1 Tax=Cacopsylla melanoneura TaxID=428564 RepID=A0A8D9E574_9HEMI